jgi:hypothetical protein
MPGGGPAPPPPLFPSLSTSGRAPPSTSISISAPGGGTTLFHLRSPHFRCQEKGSSLFHPDLKDYPYLTETLSSPLCQRHSSTYPSSQTITMHKPFGETIPHPQRKFAEQDQIGSLGILTVITFIWCGEEGPWSSQGRAQSKGEDGEP